MPQQAPQQTNQTPDLSQYEVKPGATPDLTQYEVKPTTPEDEASKERMIYGRGAVDQTSQMSPEDKAEFERGKAGGAMAASNTVPIVIAGTELATAGPLVGSVARRLATGVLGGAVGAEAGKYGGHLFGPTGSRVGQVIGGVLGSLAGSGAFGERARTIGNPSELPLIGKYLPDWLTPKETILPPKIAGTAPEAIDTPREPIMGPNEPAPVPKQPNEGTPRLFHEEYSPAGPPLIPSLHDTPFNLGEQVPPVHQSFSDRRGYMTLGDELRFKSLGMSPLKSRGDFPPEEALYPFGKSPKSLVIPGSIIGGALLSAIAYESGKHPGTGLKFDETPLPTDKIITPLIAPSPKQIDAATGKKGVEHKSLIQPHKTIQRTESEHGNIPQNAIGVLQNKAGTTIGWYDQEGHHLFPKEK